MSSGDVPMSKNGRNGDGDGGDDGEYYGMDDDHAQGPLPGPLAPGGTGHRGRGSSGNLGAAAGTAAPPPPPPDFSLFEKVRAGLDTNATVGWDLSWQSFDAAIRGFRSPEAQLFLRQSYLQVTTIMLDQHPFRIGAHERGCVEKLLERSVALATLCLRDGRLEHVEALTHVFSKKKTLYKGGKQNWQNMPGLPEIRMQRIAQFADKSGFDYLAALLEHEATRAEEAATASAAAAAAKRLTLQAPLASTGRKAERDVGAGTAAAAAAGLAEPAAATGEAAAPPLARWLGAEPLQILLVACADSTHPDQPALALQLCRAVMRHMAALSEDELKKENCDNTACLVRDVRRIMHTLGSAEGEEMYRFWLALTLRYMRASSLPLRLFGWDQVQELINWAGHARLPPEAYRAMCAGTPEVNGVYRTLPEAGAPRDVPPKYTRRTTRPAAPAVPAAPPPAPLAASAAGLELEPSESPESEPLLLTLFRCKMRTQSNWWFLSEADEALPGTDKDIDYYQHKSRQDEEQEPPSFGWITAQNGNFHPGRDPPPVLTPLGWYGGDAFGSPLEAALLEWALRHRVVEELFGDSIHREVVARSAPLLKFLSRTDVHVRVPPFPEPPPPPSPSTATAEAEEDGGDYDDTFGEGAAPAVTAASAAAAAAAGHGVEASAIGAGWRGLRPEWMQFPGGLESAVEETTLRLPQARGAAMAALEAAGDARCAHDLIPRGALMPADLDIIWAACVGKAESELQGEVYALLAAMAPVMRGDLLVYLLDKLRACCALGPLGPQPPTPSTASAAAAITAAGGCNGRGGGPFGATALLAGAAGAGAGGASSVGATGVTDNDRQGVSEAIEFAVKLSEASGPEFLADASPLVWEALLTFLWRLLLTPETKAHKSGDAVAAFFRRLLEAAAARSPPPGDALQRCFLEECLHCISTLGLREPDGGGGGNGGSGGGFGGGSGSFGGGGGVAQELSEADEAAVQRALSYTLFLLEIFPAGVLHDVVWQKVPLCRLEDVGQQGSGEGNGENLLRLLIQELRAFKVRFRLRVGRNVTEAAAPAVLEAGLLQRLDVIKKVASAAADRGLLPLEGAGRSTVEPAIGPLNAEAAAAAAAAATAAAAAACAAGGSGEAEGMSAAQLEDISSVLSGTPKERELFLALLNQLAFPSQGAPALSDPTMNRAFEDLVCRSTDWTRLGPAAYMCFNAFLSWMWGNMHRGDGGGGGDSPNMELATDTLWRITLSAQNAEVASRATQDLLNVYSSSWDGDKLLPAAVATEAAGVAQIGALGPAVAPFATASVTPASIVAEAGSRGAAAEVAGAARRDGFVERIFRHLAEAREELQALRNRREEEGGGGGCGGMASEGEEEARRAKETDACARVQRCLGLLQGSLRTSKGHMYLSHRVRGMGARLHVVVHARRLPSAPAGGRSGGARMNRVEKLEPFTLDIHLLQTFSALRLMVADHQNHSIQYTKLTYQPKSNFPEETTMLQLGICDGDEMSAFYQPIPSGFGVSAAHSGTNTFATHKQAVSLIRQQQVAAAEEAAGRAIFSGSADRDMDGGGGGNDAVHMGDAIAADEDHFDVLFQLLEAVRVTPDQQETALAIWELLQTLPTQLALLARVRRLALGAPVEGGGGGGGEKAGGGWPELLSAQSWYRLVYVLQIIDYLLRPYDLLAAEPWAADGARFRRGFCGFGSGGGGGRDGEGCDGFATVLRVFLDTPAYADASAAAFHAVALRVVKACIFREGASSRALAAAGGGSGGGAPMSDTVRGSPDGGGVTDMEEDSASIAPEEETVPAEAADGGGAMAADGESSGDELVAMVNRGDIDLRKLVAKLVAVGLAAQRQCGDGGLEGGSGGSSGGGSRNGGGGSSPRGDGNQAPPPSVLAGRASLAHTILDCLVAIELIAARFPDTMAILATTEDAAVLVVSVLLRNPARKVRRRMSGLVTGSAMLAPHVFRWLTHEIDGLDQSGERYSEYFVALSDLVQRYGSAAAASVAGAVQAHAGLELLLVTHQGPNGVVMAGGGDQSGSIDLAMLGRALASKLMAMPRDGGGTSGGGGDSGGGSGSMSFHGGGGSAASGQCLSVLIGCLTLLRCILAASPLAPEDLLRGTVLGEDLVGVLFSEFLFALPAMPPSRGSPSSAASRARAICREPAARRAAFDVLSVVARRSREGLRRVRTMVAQQVNRAGPGLRHRWCCECSPEAKRSGARFVGMKNQGCTCYMNSLLQQLFMVPPLREAILAVELPRPAPPLLPDPYDLVGKRVRLRWAGGALHDAVVESYEQDALLHLVRYTEGGETAVLALHEGRLGKETGEFHVYSGPGQGGGGQNQGSGGGGGGGEDDGGGEGVEKYGCPPPALVQVQAATVAAAVTAGIAPGSGGGGAADGSGVVSAEDAEVAAAAAAAAEKQRAEQEATRRVLVQLQRTFCYLRDSERRAFDPRALVEACRCLNLQYNVYQQNDASEFCDQLLDKVEAALKGTAQARLLERCFGGKLVYQKIPRGCEHRTDRTDPFINLELIIRGKDSIQESLAALTEGELMEGDNKVECEECGTRKDTVRRTCLGTLPNLLILHLKRFDLDFTTFETVKLNNRCAFPMRLDVKPYTKKGIEEREALEEALKAATESGAVLMDTSDADIAAAADAEYLYDLKGILVHAGIAQGGHYYSYIRDCGDGAGGGGAEAKEGGSSGGGDGGDMWYRFDDEDVTVFSPASIETSCFGGTQTVSQTAQGATMEQERVANALLLFYEKVVPRRDDDADAAASAASAAAPAVDGAAAVPGAVLPLSGAAAPADWHRSGKRPAEERDLRDGTADTVTPMETDQSPSAADFCGGGGGGAEAVTAASAAAATAAAANAAVLAAAVRPAVVVTDGNTAFGEEVWRANVEFLLHSYVFDNEFHAFVRELLLSTITGLPPPLPPPPLPTPDAPEASLPVAITGTAPAGFGSRCNGGNDEDVTAAVKVAVTLLLDIVLHSKERGFGKSWTELLSEALGRPDAAAMSPSAALAPAPGGGSGSSSGGGSSSSGGGSRSSGVGVAAAEWLVDALQRPGARGGSSWLRLYMLECPDSQARKSVVKLAAHAFAIVATSPEETAALPRLVAAAAAVTAGGADATAAAAAAAAPPAGGLAAAIVAGPAPAGAAAAKTAAAMVPPTALAAKAAAAAVLRSRVGAIAATLTQLVDDSLRQWHYCDELYELVREAAAASEPLRTVLVATDAVARLANLVMWDHSPVWLKEAFPPLDPPGANQRPPDLQAVFDAISALVGADGPAKADLLEEVPDVPPAGAASAAGAGIGRGGSLGGVGTAGAVDAAVAASAAGAGAAAAKAAAPELTAAARAAFTALFASYAVDGSMNADDMMRYLEVSGLREMAATPLALRNLIHRYEGPQASLLSLDGFLRYCRDVAAERPKDAWTHLYKNGFRSDLLRYDDIGIAAAASGGSGVGGEGGGGGSSAGAAAAAARQARGLPKLSREVLSQAVFYEAVILMHSVPPTAVRRLLECACWERRDASHTLLGQTLQSLWRASQQQAQGGGGGSGWEAAVELLTALLGLEDSLQHDRVVHAMRDHRVAVLQISGHYYQQLQGAPYDYNASEIIRRYWNVLSRLYSSIPTIRRYLEDNRPLWDWMRAYQSRSHVGGYGHGGRGVDLGVLYGGGGSLGGGGGHHGHSQLPQPPLQHHGGHHGGSGHGGGHAGGGNHRRVPTPDIDDEDTSMGGAGNSVESESANGDPDDLLDDAVDSADVGGGGGGGIGGGACGVGGVGADELLDDEDEEVLADRTGDEEGVVLQRAGLGQLDGAYKKVVLEHEGAGVFERVGFAENGRSTDPPVHVSIFRKPAGTGGFRWVVSSVPPDGRRGGNEPRTEFYECYEQTRDGGGRGSPMRPGFPPRQGWAVPRHDPHPNAALPAPTVVYMYPTPLEHVYDDGADNAVPAAVHRGSQPFVGGGGSGGGISGRRQGLAPPPVRGRMGPVEESGGEDGDSDAIDADDAGNSDGGDGSNDNGNGRNGGGGNGDGDNLDDHIPLHFTPSVSPSRSIGGGGGGPSLPRPPRRPRRRRNKEGTSASGDEAGDELEDGDDEEGVGGGNGNGNGGGMENQDGGEDPGDGLDGGFI